MADLQYIKVTASSFSGSLVIEDGRCVHTSAILAYMRGWTEARVLKYLKRRRWAMDVTDKADIEKWR